MYTVNISALQTTIHKYNDIHLITNYVSLLKSCACICMCLNSDHITVKKLLISKCECCSVKRDFVQFEHFQNDN